MEVTGNVLHDQVTRGPARSGKGESELFHQRDDGLASKGLVRDGNWALYRSEQLFCTTSAKTSEIPEPKGTAQA